MGYYVTLLYGYAICVDYVFVSRLLLFMDFCFLSTPEIPQHYFSKHRFATALLFPLHRSGIAWIISVLPYSCILKDSLVTLSRTAWNSLGSPGWPQTYNSFASTSLLQGLETCTTLSIFPYLLDSPLLYIYYIINYLFVLFLISKFFWKCTVFCCLCYT